MRKRAWPDSAAKCGHKDHKFQQPVVVGIRAKQGGTDVPFDVEGSGYGFKTVKQFKAAEVAMPSSCKMSRPAL